MQKPFEKCSRFVHNLSWVGISLMVTLALLLLEQPLLHGQSTFGGGQAVFRTELSTIPFELRGHKIYVSLRINASPRPYSFILDTGALTSMDQRTLQELGLSRGRALAAGGEIRYAYQLQEEVNVTLGEVGVDRFRMTVMDFSYFYQSDPDMHGFLGSDFLHHFYVKIDYRHRELVLSRYPLPLPAVAGVQRIRINTANQAFLPRVECRIDNRWSWNGLIDTGAPFAVVFPLTALDRQRNSRAPVIESEGVIAGWPTSHIEKNYLSWVEELKIGELSLTDLPVLFSNCEDIILGEEFLSQYVLYLFYPDNELILVPQGTGRLRNNFYSAGIKLAKTADQRTIIEAIWKGSAADRAGIRTHMEIIQINGRLSRELSLSDLTRILNNDRMPVLEVQVKDGYREQTYQLKKTPLLPETP